jgi:hypothetical protein
MAQPKQYFTVRLEATAPFTISYRVFAEDEEEALKIFEKSPVVNISRPQLSRMRKMKATVYVSGTNLVKKVKSFMGL